MAPVSKFKSRVAASVGNSYVNVFQAPVGKDCFVIGLNIACKSAGGVQANVRLFKNSQTLTVFIVEDCPIPVGSSLNIVDGDKIVIEAGDYVEVQCNTPGESVDVIVSYVEDVNS